MNQETTVAEAREIMGSDSDKFSDKEIEKMVRDLDFIAGIVIKEYMKRESPIVDIT